MEIRIVSYNIEWFDDHFNKNNSLKTAAKSVTKLNAVKEVLQMINADIICIIEAPNTTTTTGNQNTLLKLENFATWAGLSTTKAVMGFVSAGRQEIAMLYNPNKMTITHAPGGSSGTKSNPPFNEELFIDTDDDGIKEVYKNYRPPFEAKVELSNGSEFFLMGVHAKSKGVFANVDLPHLERESVRNRLKLYAECAWIRTRADQWLEEGKKFAIMGDMNDGPGMDMYETRHSKSAVETIMGDIFDAGKVLKHYIGRPKWTANGWSPSTTRFKDKITEDYIAVMIDHILCSPNLPVVGDEPVRIWNPYEDATLASHKKTFKEASDHYPLTLEIDV